MRRYKASKYGQNGGANLSDKQKEKKKQGSEKELTALYLHE